MTNLNEQATSFNKTIMLMYLLAKLDMGGATQTWVETLTGSELKAHISRRLCDDKDICAFVIRAKNLLGRGAECTSYHDIFVCTANRKTYGFSDPEVISVETMSEKMEKWFDENTNGIFITN